MIDELSQFSVVEILAMTALGESEGLGAKGMQQTINTNMNRVRANKAWMGGNDVRSVCLARDQYDVWWPETNNDDRERVINIAKNTPTYGPYLVALSLAARAIAGCLPDITNSAVSYGDDGKRPETHPGAKPCLIDGSRIFFNIFAVA